MSKYIQLIICTLFLVFLNTSYARTYSTNDNLRSTVPAYSSSELFEDYIKSDAANVLANFHKNNLKDKYATQIRYLVRLEEDFYVECEVLENLKNSHFTNPSEIRSQTKKVMRLKTRLESGIYDLQDKMQKSQE